jgi:GNAT superfamily N-acetyltransferase
MLRYRITRVDGTDEETAELIKEMHTTCFRGSAPQAEPESDYWWIAYHGTEPAAFAALAEAYATPNLGYLKRSGVLPQHRGRGLQLRLIRVRERAARKMGCDGMISDTTDNPASSNTLIRAGYRIFKPQRPWAFEDSIYWEKDL